jgi:hypothetical protein
LLLVIKSVEAVQKAPNFVIPAFAGMAVQGLFGTTPGTKIKKAIKVL